jgi:hypothetical protein
LLACAGCASPVAELQSAVRRHDDAFVVAQLAATDDWIVEDAARYLGSIDVERTARALPALRAVLTREGVGPRARFAAALALSRIAPESEANTVIAALERATDPDERYWLVVSVGRSCGLPSRAALSSRLSDSEELVARAARKALADCASRAAGPTP